MDPTVTNFTIVFAVITAICICLFYLICKRKSDLIKEIHIAHLIRETIDPSNTQPHLTHTNNLNSQLRRADWFAFMVVVLVFTNFVFFMINAADDSYYTNQPALRLDEIKISRKAISE